MKAKFADRLIEVMDEKDISVSELSRKTGINKSSISRYRKENYNPGKKNFFILADVLGVNPAWLAGEDAPKSPYSSSLFDIEPWEKEWYKNPLSSRSDTLSDTESHLISAFRAADPAIRAAVCKILDVEETDS